MATLNGNVVTYGSGANWYVRVNITNTAAGTGPTVRVSGNVEVVFSSSVSDGVNTGSWSVDGVGETETNNNYSFGAGGGVVSVGSFSFDAAVNYGALRNISVYATITGIAGGGTGPSTVNTTYALPARLPSPPSTPAAPTVTSVGQNSATVNMVLPANNGAAVTSTTYKIYTAPSGGSLVTSYVDTGAATAHVFALLSPSTTYYASVLATNSAGDSTESARTAFTTGPAVLPDAPAAPTMSAITKTTATSSWTAPATNGATITGYQLQVDDNADFGTPLLDTNVVGSPANLTGLTSYTGYFERIRAATPSGYSAWSPAAAFTTAADVPLAPPAATVSAISLTRATIDLAAATPRGSAVTGYQVQVSTSSTFGTTVYDVTSVSMLHELTGLPSNTTLYLRYRANSAEGFGAWSTVQSFVTEVWLWTKVSSTWMAGELWMNLLGAWKRVELWLNVAGTWKRVL